MAMFSLHFQCSSARKIGKVVCEGKDILDVGASIEGFNNCSPCDLSLSSLREGFTISLTNNDYKIIGFRLVYTNNNKHVFVTDIVGNKIDALNFKQLKDFEVGNFISIECINIKKGELTALSTSVTVYIAK